MLSVMSIIEGGERELSLLSYVVQSDNCLYFAAAKAANANGDRLRAYGHMVQRRTAALTQGVVFFRCFVLFVLFFDLCCFKTVWSFAAFYREFFAAVSSAVILNFLN